MALKVLYYLSNRASYYRSKVLLDKMNRDLEIDLKVMITSSLTTNSFKEVRNEIMSKYDKVVTIPFNSYDGTLFTMSLHSAKLTESITKYLNANETDVAICFADRFELLPFAMSCAYLNIPLAQIQAGEDSGNIDQKIRHSVSMLSDMTFASHKKAYKRLKCMKANQPRLTGCPSIDVIKELNIEKTNSVHDYFLCIFHPHTKELMRLETQVNMLLININTFLRENDNYRCYWFGSNNDPGYEQIMKKYQNKITPITNMVERQYLKLLAGSKFIIGNSSSGLREASYLGVAAVNVGNRQQDRVRDKNVIQTDFEDIYDAMKKASRMKVKPSKLFGDGNASDRIIKELKQWMLRQN